MACVLSHPTYLILKEVCKEDLDFFQYLKFGKQMTQRVAEELRYLKRFTLSVVLALEETKAMKEIYQTLPKLCKHKNQ